jgi:hypothetical protein
MATRTHRSGSSGRLDSGDSFALVFVIPPQRHAGDLKPRLQRAGSKRNDLWRVGRRFRIRGRRRRTWTGGGEPLENASQIGIE